MPHPKATPKPEETWRRARLIPTTGIGGQDEQEQRATSSLLAVMGAVPQFGRAILAHVGAPAGRIQTFTEIRFIDEDTKLSIPDGAVVIERGKARWVCLIEVKTAGAELRVDQVERYLDLARVNGFDAVLTISNQLTASPVESPIAIDPKKTRKIALRHLSWWQVMTEARVEHKHRGVSDPTARSCKVCANGHPRPLNCPHPTVSPPRSLPPNCHPSPARSGTSAMQPSQKATSS